MRNVSGTSGTPHRPLQQRNHRKGVFPVAVNRDVLLFVFVDHIRHGDASVDSIRCLLGRHGCMTAERIGRHGSRSLGPTRPRERPAATG